ncbi:NAD-dependent epimerase/dehydratase family protein [Frigoribacterium sp. CFBP 13712]|uniref:NAD-dependent epimerase/dehydratase family protein n=1 Tax=Frigoribacterium sp. CFBP 13712 TaxID=2775309 RepID=UPI001783C85C|nr:NAD-dependent epimerase/dehydratase family protein [Frigoribacterium sp. CFBP 13712]MBD8704543.1 NAD-dependent epimerase/dehydratase family protein [Frigoribacterium sp. CFBP 13712]
MRILVLGGTAWLGRHIASTAIGAGHEVMCLARGTDVPDGATLVRADRDRDDALVGAALIGAAGDVGAAGAAGAAARWDAVIDVAREPGHVRRAVRALEPVADRYLFVSTTSVYASDAELGADETAERVEPLAADLMDGPDDYGPAKAACEDAVLAAFGPDRSLIVRPGLIGGPGDPTGRTDHWVWRFAHPARASSAPGAPAERREPAERRKRGEQGEARDLGEPGEPGIVLAPEAPDLPTAVLDVRDLADWLVRCVEQGANGVANALGEVVSFDEHLEAARRAAASDASIVRAPAEWLLAQGVGQWAGPRSMPLWIADRAWHGMNARSTVRARSLGLEPRLLVETLRDALDWRSRQTDPDTRPSGLSSADHATLLAELGARAT